MSHFDEFLYITAKYVLIYDTAFRKVKVHICNFLSRHPINDTFTASKRSVEDSCKFKVSFQFDDKVKKTFLEKQAQPGFDWPKDPPVNIMLKADNGKFLYNHRTKNVVTAKIGLQEINHCPEVYERCQFSLEVMYPQSPTIANAKIHQFYRTIIEARIPPRPPCPLTFDNCDEKLKKLE